MDADDSELPSALINQMTKTELNYWLSHFVVEVRRRDGELYPPNTLYQICCGLQRAIRETNPDWNLFTQPEFSDFRDTLDAQMKDSRAKGLGNNKRQAEPITAEEENIMWASGVLGTHSPQVLVDTLFFSHWNVLWLTWWTMPADPQIPLQRSYLKYVEDVSKNNQEGIKMRKIEPKTVIQHENIENPDRCIVRIFRV